MTLRFLTFDLNEDRRELRDQGALVSLAPKAFDVLCYLITHRERMVSKAELLEEFWSMQVSEAALQKAISLLRKATRCDRQSVIRTHHGLGFRFVPDVLTSSQDKPPTQCEHSTPMSERSLVAVLCVRIGVEAPQEDLVTEEFLNQARACVEAHHGKALRMTLEGFMASFGLDTHFEDAARQAVHCAVALNAAADRCDKLPVIMGIDHGRVDLSQDADKTNWRRPSDIERGASELASRGEPSDVLLSVAVQQQLRDEVTCIAIEHGFRLTAVNDLQAGVPGRPQKQPSHFVGRMAELAFLSESLEGAGSGHGQGVTLSGPAGIGKTRLLSEFLATLDTSGFRSLKVQCLPSLSNTALAPIRDMYRALFVKAPADVIRTDIDTALHAELLGEATAHAAVLNSLSEHQRKQQSYILVSRMLAAHCVEQTLVLAFEDVHWLDVSSRDCLEAVIGQTDGTRLLVVMTTRPTDDPPLSEAMVQLSPLRRHDGLKLLRDNINATEIDADVADDLVRRAAGNPFFIEELALASQSGDDPSHELPETVQAVISVRIGALDPADRMFLYVIAVVGHAARIDLVSHLLGQSADVVDATAARLRSMGFILAEPGAYSFRHMLINDTAYAMLAPAERRKLHGKIAAYLEGDAPSRAPQPEELAWHYQEAGEVDQATEYWLKACRTAMQRLAHREGIVFAQNGLALIAAGGIDSPKRELDLQLYLAFALTALKGYGADDVGEAYSQAQKMNKVVGDPRANIRVLFGLWINAWVSGRLSKSLVYAQDMLDVTNVANDPDLNLQAHASMGQVLMHKGRLGEALGHLNMGLDAIADRPPTSSPAQIASVACSAFACWTNCMIGNQPEADRILDVSYQLAHAHENPLARAVHFGLCHEPFMFTGQVERCLDYADRNISISRTHDFAFWLGTGLVMRGWALGQMGRMDTAFDALDEGISVFEATGAGVQLSNWYGLKAETLLTAGRLKEGLKAADHALDCADRTGDVYFTPRIHTVAARLWSELNERENATRHAEKAKQRAAEFGMAKLVTTLLI